MHAPIKEVVDFNSNFLKLSYNIIEADADKINDSFTIETCSLIIMTLLKCCS